MKTFVVAITTLLFLFNSFAQEVVSTQGDSFSNASGSIDFTIGEPVIFTATDGSNDLTQGFHQTNWEFVGLEEYDVVVEASIFPNPTEETLNIKTSNFDNIQYGIHDDRGRLVLNNVLESEVTPIGVAHLAPGPYTVTLLRDDQPIKAFKLIKHSK